jgi:phage FluMu gp28-like protein
VARTSDKSVIWTVQRVGDIFWTRDVHTMRRASFAEQLAAFDTRMRLYAPRRACIDKTGLGMPIVEEAQARWGQYRVEGVTFTGEVKQHLATYGKQLFEDKRVRIPVSRDIRDSHHAVRKMMTVAGNPRFDADRNEAGHADEFWAHMLALHAGETNLQPSAGESIDADVDAYRSTGFGRGRRTPMFADRRDRVERAVSASGRQGAPNV